MTTHDFRRLSWLDFEELVHDLLRAEWKQPLEAFKTGPDQGIDLRHTSAGGGTTIVQCKHYVGSGYSKLRAALKGEELPKIQKLTPNRYVLITSVPLSLKQKDELKADLAPYVLDTADIVGYEGVEGLLRAYPEVEKAHYKLWLTSSAVLEKVVHAAEACKTDFQLERITAKLPLYVQSNVYPNALKILEDERVLIISGEPGIGKTTLAEMLIYAHLADGYIPAVIESEISEGRKVFNKTRKSIFYFDDFLGQTYLGDRSDYTGRNQDMALVEFMEMIRDSESRLILTTRETILSGAIRQSERLSQSPFVAYKCILQLADYTREQRGRILYNHLAFSSLPDVYRTELLHGDFFLQVIDHKHFNPRVIDWITSEPRLRGIDASYYREHVAAIINDPTAIWRHAFENQISVASRYILLVLYSSGTSTTIAELQRAWTSSFDYAAKKYNFSRKPNEFREALRELTGGFISLRGQEVSFLNPSVRDYVASALGSSRDFVTDIANSAVRIMQLKSLYNLGDTKYPRLIRWFLDDPDSLVARIAPMLSVEYYRFRHISNVLTVEHFELSILEQVKFIVKLAESTHYPAFVTLLTKAIDVALAYWEARGAELPYAVAMLETMSEADWLMHNGGAYQTARVESILISGLERGSAEDWLAILDRQSDTILSSKEAKEAVAKGFDFFLTNGIKLEEEQCTDAVDYTTFAESLEMIEIRHNIDLSAKIKELEEKAAELESYEEERDGIGSTSVPTSVSAPAAPSATDEKLRQMFNSIC